MFVTMDDNVCHAKTIHKMRLLIMAMEKMPRTRLENIKTVHELIKEMEERNLITEPFEGYYAVDGWGEPFQVFIVNDRFAIVSRGPNGEDENGKGDDLVIEACLTKD